MPLSPLQVPLLEAGDIIIDGGNSEYNDTTVAHGETLCAGVSVVAVDVSHGAVCLSFSLFPAPV